MNKSTLPIILEDDNGFRFFGEEKITCTMRNKFHGDQVWIDENGNEYFRYKHSKKFGFKKFKKI